MNRKGQRRFRTFYEYIEFVFKNKIGNNRQFYNKFMNQINQWNADSYTHCTEIIENFLHQKYIQLSIYMRCSMFSNQFKANKSQINSIMNLEQLAITKSKKSFVSTIIDGQRFFGLPKYFFRLNFTYGICDIPCCEVQ